MMTRNGYLEIYSKLSTHPFLTLKFDFQEWILYICCMYVHVTIYVYMVMKHHLLSSPLLEENGLKTVFKKEPFLMVNVPPVRFCRNFRWGSRGWSGRGAEGSLTFLLGLRTSEIFMKSKVVDFKLVYFVVGVRSLQKF